MVYSPGTSVSIYNNNNFIAKALPNLTFQKWSNMVGMCKKKSYLVGACNSYSRVGKKKTTRKEQTSFCQYKNGTSKLTMKSFEELWVVCVLYTENGVTFMLLLRPK